MAKTGKKTLIQNKAIALWKEGKEAWNNWAVRHKGWYVDFSGVDFSPHTDNTNAGNGNLIDFEGFSFPGRTNFREATFSGSADFHKTTFVGDVDFTKTTFSDNAYFHKATFSDRVNFSEATFINFLNFRETVFTGRALFLKTTFTSEADFIETTFSGGTHFDGAIFSGGADFIETTFSGGASFTNTTFSGDTSFTKAKFSGNTNFKEVTLSGETRFIEATFSGEADFLNAKFSGSTNFRKAAFSNDADFCNAVFSGKAMFFEVVFSGKTNFLDAKFSEAAVFISIHTKRALNLYNTTFSKEASFALSTFGGPVMLSNMTLEKELPDFTLTKFSHHVAVSDIKLPDMKTIKKRDKDAGKKLRRLRELASDAKDHMMEQYFFAEELKSRRYTEPSQLKLLPNRIYGFVGDFGRSLIRPTLGLIITWMFFAGFFYGLSEYKEGAGSIWKAFQFSGAQLIPFFPLSTTARTDSFKALFEQSHDYIGVIYLLSFFESIISIFLIGLIALALRNRFKLK